MSCIKDDRDTSSLVSKTGLDKSLRKNGAGPHNWGSLTEQTHPYIHHNLDTAKLPPQNQDFKGDDVDFDDDDAAPEDQLAASPGTAAALHANAAGEQSKAVEAPNGGMQRRMSSMTEEEKEKARAWRHGALNRDTGEFPPWRRFSTRPDDGYLIQSTWRPSHELAVPSASPLPTPTPS